MPPWSSRAHRAGHHTRRTTEKPVDTATRRRQVTLIVVGAVAGLLYADFLVDVLLPTGSIGWFTVVSSLEVNGQPHGRLLRAADVLSGALTLVLVPYLRRAMPTNRWRPVAVWSTVAFAVCGAGAGLLALPCAEGAPGCPAGSAERTQIAVHDTLSIVSTTAVFACAAAVALAVRHGGPRWLTWAGWVTFGAGALTGVLFALTNLDEPGAAGAVQRLQIAVVTAWIVCLGVYAGTDGVRAGRRQRGALAA